MLFDRNNHKAAHHGALMIGGGIPVYRADRRATRWGLIGPMRWDAFDEDALRERDPQQSAGQGHGSLAPAAPVPRRRRRAMHL